MVSEGLTLADRFQVVSQVDASTYVVQPVDEPQRELLLRAVEPPADKRFPVAEELRRALDVTHPHVATVHAVGQLDDTRMFFVQDRLSSPQHLHLWAPSASTPARIEVCRQALSALEAYHRQGLVLGGQRRIQLLVEPLPDGPRLSITDPGGLSNEFFRSDLPLTQAATLAPERHLGVRVDRRANLYEFGALFYQALAGDASWRGGDPWPHLAEVGPPDLPPEVAAWVMTLLAARPRDRPSSAAAALARLERILDPSVAAEEPAAPAGSEPLVGRDAELASLLVWANALRGERADPSPPHVTRGDPSLLVLRGPAGIGKRRLVDELLTELAADGVRILRGDCAQQGQGLAGPLGTLLDRVVGEEAFGFDADAATNATRWYVRELLGRPLGRKSAQRPPQLPDPQREAERTLLALGEPLLLAATARPLLLVLDNLDQAAPMARALCEAIARRAWVARRWADSRRALDPAAPREPTLLILATSADGGQLPRGRFVRTLDLSPLEREALRQLAPASQEVTPAALQAGIPGPVVDPGALLAIDDLAERTVAETLAVLGRPGEFSLMAAVIGLGDAELRRALSALVARDTVVSCAEQRYLLREDVARRWRSELDADAVAARARRLCVVLGERHPPVPTSAQLLERVGFAALGPPPGAHAELVRELGPSAIAHLEAISGYSQAAELCGRLADVQPTLEAQWRAHQARALYRAGRWREALNAVAQARATDESTAELALLAAGCHTALGEPEAALEQLELARNQKDEPIAAARASLAAAGIHAAAGDLGRVASECELGLELVRGAGHAKDVAALRVRLLVRQADAALADRDLAEAEQLIRAASALATRVTSESVAVDVFLASARVSLAGLDAGRAAAAAAQARDVAREAGDLRGQALSAIVFARAAWRVGHAPEAREALLGGVRVAEELGDARALAEALDALGGLCHAAGALREAAQTLRRGLLSWVELRERERAATTSSALGAVLLDLGDSRGALTHLEEALEVQREVGAREGELGTLCSLIELHRRQGLYAKSLAQSVRARELAEEVGRPAARSRALIAEAAVLRTLGDLPAAERLAQRALRFAARAREQELELRARLLVGEVLARKGDADGARRNLQRVRRGAQSTGDRGTERASLLELAALELNQGRAGHARALLDSRPVPRPGRMQPWLGKGPEGVGVLRARERLLRCRIELAREKGSLHTAIRCAEEALAEARQGDLRDLEWRACYALAATYELRREHERALTQVVEAQEIVEDLQAAVPPQRAQAFLATDPVRAAALRGDSPVAVLGVQMGDVSDEGLSELRAMLSLRMPTIEPARARAPQIVEASSAAGRALPKSAPAAELGRFVGLCRDLIDETHVERVFARLVRVAVELSDAERGFLAVFGADPETYTVHATQGLADLGRPRERFARSCAFRAAEQGQLVLSADVKVSPEVRGRACLLGLGLRSVVAAPIKLPDGQRGVLFVDHAFQPERFGARDVELIEALAALGGLALGRSALEHALASRRGLDPGALQRRFLEARSAAPAASLPESLRFLPAEWPLVGRSEALGVAREALERFAATSAGLLISGPPGVGKGTLARHAAAQLQPQGAPPVVVDLRLVDPLGRALLGPELDPTRPCAARRARGGVLILERLDAAAPALQAKLLDALAERALPDGTPLEARVVATAHAPELAVESGALRADLLALAGTIRANLPALDARPEDVAPLAQAILAAWGEAAPTLGEGALEALAARGWPGNARELYGVLRTLALRAGTPPLAAEDVPPLGRESLTAALEAQARLLIHGALARAGGDLEAARARLGLTAEELAAWVGAPRGPGSEDAPEG